VKLQKNEEDLRTILDAITAKGKAAIAAPRQERRSIVCISVVLLFVNPQAECCSL
jgi:hypothetical protein